jgi:prephenate dehydrogenase
MNIGIVGLGLMGASFAKAWSRTHHIIGFDIDPVVGEKAMNDQIIHTFVLTPSEVYQDCDILFICLYPQATQQFIEQHQASFPKGILVCDIAGVKSVYQDLVLRDDVNFLWTHPIAGRAISGYDAHNTQMFQGANFIITPTKPHQEKDIDLMTGLAKEIGFASITLMNVNDHDNMIAYTSQLTHAIAVSLMNTAADDSFVPIIGDSFRDLTRIARINDVMWSELFLLNKPALIKQMELFQTRVEELRQALIKEDREAVQSIMRSSKQKRDYLP